MTVNCFFTHSLHTWPHLCDRKERHRCWCSAKYDGVTLFIMCINVVITLGNRINITFGKFVIDSFVMILCLVFVLRMTCSIWIFIIVQQWCLFRICYFHSLRLWQICLICNVFFYLFFLCYNMICFHLRNTVDIVFHFTVVIIIGYSCAVHYRWMNIISHYEWHGSTMRKVRRGVITRWVCILLLFICLFVCAFFLYNMHWTAIQFLFAISTCFEIVPHISWTLHYTIGINSTKLNTCLYTLLLILPILFLQLLQKIKLVYVSEILCL